MEAAAPLVVVVAAEGRGVVSEAAEETVWRSDGGDRCRARAPRPPCRATQ
jgi:hypothetical protein